MALWRVEVTPEGTVYPNNVVGTETSGDGYIVPYTDGSAIIYIHAETKGRAIEHALARWALISTTSYKSRQRVLVCRHEHISE